MHGLPKSYVLLSYKDLSISLKKAELEFERKIYTPSYIVSIINPIPEFAAKQAVIQVLDSFDKKERGWHF